MPDHPRSIRRRLLAWALLPWLALTSLGYADETPEPPAAEAPPSALTLEGSAAFKELQQIGRITFRYDAEARNPGEAPLSIESGNLFLAHPGGWLVPLDPESLDGSFFRGRIEIPPGTRSIAGQHYAAVTSPSHALLSVHAADGHAEAVTPIVRLGYERPADYKPAYPFGVGVVGPLHVLPFSDGTTSVLLIGQHQVLSGGKPSDVQTTVSIGGDKGSTDPVTWSGLDAKGDRAALWPFVRRLETFSGLGSGQLRISTDAEIDGRKVHFAGTWPVTAIEPVAVRAPVLGTWQLSNGPGSPDTNDHYANPQFRYAYDMVVLEQGRTHRGDPHRNESYFAWNRSIRAVADGEVVDICDQESDNPGYRGALTICYNNRVVIRHADGFHTAYLHIRQRSRAGDLKLGDVVKAGQVIARVGNSGDSSEPHLHFMGFRIDETGRWVSVPVTFTNAFHDARGTQPVLGVPVGGSICHFQDAR